MHKTLKKWPLPRRATWYLGLIAILVGIAVIRPGLLGVQSGSAADSLRTTTGDRPLSPEDRSSLVPGGQIGPEQSGRRASGASEEIAAAIQRIEESAGGGDLVVFSMLVDRIVRSASVRVREGILMALASPGANQMNPEFRDLALTLFASSLATDYRVGEMLRIVDVSTREGRLSWEKYLHSRSGANTMEVIEIRPDNPLFVESAQRNASRLLALSTPSKFRTAVESGLIDPGTAGFASGVRELLKLDSMKCSEWIYSFPENSPERRRGLRVVGEWLREIGRHEEAKAFLIPH